MNSSKSLFTLTACALVAAAVPAFANTTLTTWTTTITDSSTDASGNSLADYAGTYSGNIFEVTASRDISANVTASPINVYTTDGSGNIGSSTSVTNGGESVTLTNGSNTESGTLWHHFVATGASLTSTATCGHTLYVSSSTLQSGNVVVSSAFGPQAFGGLIVGESTNTFSLGRSSGTDIVMHLVGSGSAGCTFVIGSDTKLLANNGFSVQGAQDWTVASGKELSFMRANGTTAGTVTIADGSVISVSGGGTVSMGDVVVAKASGGAGTITFDGSTTGGVITLAQGESYSDYESVFSVSEGTTLTYSSLKASGVSDGFTGTVELKNISSGSVDLSNYGVSGSTLKVDGVSGAWLSSATLGADIEIGSNGLTVDNGSSGSGNTAGIFAGKITGAGTITFNKWTSGSGATQVQASQTGGYKFTGDMTGFSGDISYNQATALQFGADTAAAYASTATAEDGVIKNIAGTGSITVSAGAALTFSYTGGANGETLALGNSSITASSSTITFSGGADYLVNSTLSASALTISAGTTTLAGATNTVSGALTVSAGANLGLAVEDVSAGSVTFAEGAKLVLDNALLASVDTDSAVAFTLDLITSDSITFGETLLTTENVSTFGDSWVSFGTAFDGYDRAFSYDNNTLSLTLTAIPEPSAFGLLAGVGALALVAARRRRK